MRCSNRAHFVKNIMIYIVLWRNFGEILVNFLEILGNFEKFWETLPQFTHVRCSN